MEIFTFIDIIYYREIYFIQATYIYVTRQNEKNHLLLSFIHIKAGLRWKIRWKVIICAFANAICSIFLGTGLFREDRVNFERFSFWLVYLHINELRARAATHVARFTCAISEDAVNCNIAHGMFRLTIIFLRALEPAFCDPNRPNVRWWL